MRYARTLQKTYLSVSSAPLWFLNSLGFMNYKQCTDIFSKKSQGRSTLDYPLGLETGFLCQILVLVPKIREETRFLG